MLIESDMQQQLDPRLGVTAPDSPPGQRRRDDLRVVEDEHITRSEQLSEVAHHPVFEAIGLHDQKLC
jgi:hypothetical protein